MKTKLTKSNCLVVIVIVTIILYACNYNPRAGLNEETPTRGKIKIGVDESFTLMSEAELYTFQSIYNYAFVTPLYKPELDVLNDFINDSVRLMITTRKLTDNETNYLKSKQINARTTTIAYDALAFIINKKNKDSLIRYNTIKNIFEGKIEYWNQINTSHNNTGKVKVVFDNNKSANVRFIKEKFKIDSFPKYCYSANKNDEVVSYVEKHINALGIVSVNWISDQNDSITRGFLKRVKVVAITSEYDSEGDQFYRPYQAYIADKSYPFIREVYAISRETFSGLGSGLIAFIAGEKGQRIILKMGMVPATMPVRIIQTKQD